MLSTLKSNCAQDAHPLAIRRTQRPPNLRYKQGGSGVLVSVILQTKNVSKVLLATPLATAFNIPDWVGLLGLPWRRWKWLTLPLPLLPENLPPYSADDFLPRFPDNLPSPTADDLPPPPEDNRSFYHHSQWPANACPGMTCHHWPYRAHLQRWLMVGRTRDPGLKMLPRCPARSVGWCSRWSPPPNADALEVRAAPDHLPLTFYAIIRTHSSVQCGHVAAGPAARQQLVWGVEAVTCCKVKTKLSCWIIILECHIFVA